MRGFGALLLHLTILTVTWFVAATAAFQNRQRRLRRVLFAGAIIAVAGLMSLRFAAYCYSLVWIRSLSAEEVVSLSLAGREINSKEAKESVVAALRESGWYFRTGGLGEGSVLQLRLASGEQVEWRFYRDPRTSGAVILLWRGAGLNLGELFCARLLETASAIGIRTN